MAQLIAAPSCAEGMHQFIIVHEFTHDSLRRPGEKVYRQLCECCKCPHRVSTISEHPLLRKSKVQV